MQKEGLVIADQKNNFLKEVQVEIETMEETALGIYQLLTGHITLSAEEDVNMEGMSCTGEILDDMSCKNARIYICKIEAERYENMDKKWMPLNLTYDFLKASYMDTVITEFDIQLINTITGNIMPFQICTFKLCFESGKELDYSDKISVFVLNDLAEVA